MNREEAARLLEYHRKNEPTYIGLGDALRMAIAALNEVGSPTTQLDENGLVPCGCGGTPEIVTHDGIYHYVHCTRCGIKSEPVFMGSTTKWNTAMGYKGGAE